MARCFSFPKSLRLLSRRDFFIHSYQKNDCKGRFIVVEYKDNSLDFSRLGITVTKKFGKAVLRNRFRRLIRESFRLDREKMIQGVDIVVRPLSSASLAGFHELKEELLYLLQKKE